MTSREYGWHSLLTFAVADRFGSRLLVLPEGTDVARYGHRFLFHQPRNTGIRAVFSNDVEGGKRLDHIPNGTQFYDGSVPFQSGGSLFHDGVPQSWSLTRLKTKKGRGSVVDHLDGNLLHAIMIRGAFRSISFSERSRALYSRSMTRSIVPSAFHTLNEYSSNTSLV